MSKKRNTIINKNRNNEVGFSLVELTITMSLALVILLTVYSMVEHFGEVTKTKHSDMRMQQESRFMHSAFATELKDAGSVITLSELFLQLGADSHQYFVGLQPLNQTNYGDGVILATGDPEAVAFLSEPFTPGQEYLRVSEVKVEEHDPAFPGVTPEWGAKDIGIVVGENGYYIFEVTRVVDNSEKDRDYIFIRNTAVYYSGLLNTSSDTAASNTYVDPPPGGGVTGKTITYPGSESGSDSGTFSITNPKTMVIRLNNFAIYMFRGHTYNIGGDQRTVQQWVRVTDTNEVADVMAKPEEKGPNYFPLGVKGNIISENIHDMQISYMVSDADTFAGTDPDTTIADENNFYGVHGFSYTDADLITALHERSVRQITVSVVSITDEYAGQGKITPVVPPLGDRGGYDMPTGKYGMKVFSFHVENRNMVVNINQI